ncbi:hypothetical protein E2I00_004170, partial [Balaenoptera physalus]
VSRGSCCTKRVVRESGTESRGLVNHRVVLSSQAVRLMCRVEAATLHRRLRLVDSAGATWCSQEACLAPRQQLVVAAWKDAKRRSLGPLEIAVTERDVCCRAGQSLTGVPGDTGHWSSCLPCST